MKSIKELMILAACEKQDLLNLYLSSKSISESDIDFDDDGIALCFDTEENVFLLLREATEHNGAIDSFVQFQPIIFICYIDANDAFGDLDDFVNLHIQD